MKITKLDILVISFFVLLSVGFFLDGIASNVTSLSGDQINILTIVKKLDYPQLYRNDQIAADIAPLKYYTPSFVNLIRFFSGSDHEYILGLSLLNFFMSIIYSLGWYFFFSQWGNSWTAFVLSFVSRGIIWLPAYEIWGIADIWTVLPRTLLLALLPWVLLIWKLMRDRKYGYFIPFLLVGLLGNVHPISGVGIAAAILISDIYLSIVSKASSRSLLKRAFFGGMFIVIGLSPYLFTYFGNIGNISLANQTELDAAILYRIGSTITSVQANLVRWLRPQLFIFILLPYLVLFIFPGLLTNRNRAEIFSWLFFSASVIFVSYMPIPIEALLEKFNITLRVSFQLIRNAKYILVPVWVLYLFILNFLSQKYLLGRFGTKVKITSVILLIFLAITSKSAIFNNVPLIGDDIIRSLWPGFGRNAKIDTDLTKMLDWITMRTDPSAYFVGPRIIRIGADRSVIHDMAGAGMLIEGDPAKFVDAYKKEMEIKSSESDLEKACLFRSWGADYWLKESIARGLVPEYSIGKWSIYDLNNLSLSCQ